MEINRSNYEIWVIDYLDGNLDADHLIMFKNFLNKNPDIEQEMNYFEPIIAIPEEKKYHFKTSLKKKSADLSDDQFCYLCIAYFENDLSEEQSEELHVIVANNPLREKTFNLISKLRLSPGEIEYIDKSRLKKQITNGNPVLRIILAGLSVAASVAIFFLAFNNLSEEKEITTALNSTTETLDPLIQINPIEEPLINIPEQTEINTNVSSSPENVSFRTNNVDESALPVYEDPAIAPEFIEETTVIGLFNLEKIYNINVDFATPIQTGTLVAINNRTPSPVATGEPKGLKNYIAGIFRKKILKDENPASGPLKGYEIADFGIDGLNKILGWNMSFEKLTDKNGDISSLVFSSNLVKINAPARKVVVVQ
jgi:hypothetical protein